MLTATGLSIQHMCVCVCVCPCVCICVRVSVVIMINVFLINTPDCELWCVDAVVINV